MHSRIGRCKAFNISLAKHVAFVKRRADGNNNVTALVLVIAITDFSEFGTMLTTAAAARAAKAAMR